MKNIAVIGGGAAGFFAAISVKTHYSNYDVMSLIQLMMFEYCVMHIQEVEKN